MRNFFILGAAVVMTACGGVSSIGRGQEHLDGGNETGGASATGTGGGSSGKSGTGGNPGAGGQGSGGKLGSGGQGNGGKLGSGGVPNGGASSSGGNTGSAGGGNCTGVFNCPAILPCPLGEEPATPPGQCCPTDCKPSGTGGASGVRCKSSGECAVPAICKLCPDGSSSCATGACVNGQCTTTFPPCRSPVDAGSGLKWFTTCGPPVCRSPGTPTGAPVCDPKKGEAAGDTCTQDGATCDPGTACSGNLVCAAQDPRPTVGCPVSRAKYKEDIQYLSADDRAKLADNLQSIPLVRYRYKTGPERQHLGFIIEDIEPSPSVDSQQDQVDLYGYTSMAVAALQQQHAEIQALKEEVRSLKAALARGKTTK